MPQTLPLTAPINLDELQEKLQTAVDLKILDQPDSAKLHRPRPASTLIGRGLSALTSALQHGSTPLQEWEESIKHAFSHTTQELMGERDGTTQRLPYTYDLPQSHPALRRIKVNTGTLQEPKWEVLALAPSGTVFHIGAHPGCREHELMNVVDLLAVKLDQARNTLNDLSETLTQNTGTLIQGFEGPSARTSISEINTPHLARIENLSGFHMLVAELNQQPLRRPPISLKFDRTRSGGGL